MTCKSGKIGYASPNEAASAVANFRTRGRKGYGAGPKGYGKTHHYRCALCSQWHIGHSRKESSRA